MFLCTLLLLSDYMLHSEYDTVLRHDQDHHVHMHDPLQVNFRTLHVGTEFYALAEKSA
jgi:hypothetical protein